MTIFQKQLCFLKKLYNSRLELLVNREIEQKAEVYRIDLRPNA